jgi:hypothetical protein
MTAAQINQANQALVNQELKNEIGENKGRLKDSQHFRISS